MKKKYCDGGSITPQLLASLIFLSIITLALYTGITYALKAQTRNLKKIETQERATNLFKEIRTSLESDTTPEADTKNDPIWDWDTKTKDEFTIKIESLSSTVNPNFVRSNVFEKTQLKTLFMQGESSTSLQQYRVDEGLSIENSHYTKFFDPKTYTTYFSPYGFANINLIDEFAAEILGFEITGNKESGSYVRSLIQNILLDGKIITPESLQSTLGLYYDTFYPYLFAQPLMNVNFVNEFILSEILGYPDYAVANPLQKAQVLLSMRETDGIYPIQLKNILQVDATQRLWHYFGCTTWFWKITVTSESSDYIFILSRHPDFGSVGSETPQFTLVSMRQQ